MDNKHLVSSLYDAISEKNLERVRELVAPDTPGGPGGLVSAIEDLCSAFPDIHYTVDELFAEGERVAVSFRWTGTHKAPFRGFPASGRRFSNGGIAIYTVRDGKVTGAVLETNRLGFLQELGVVPPDAALREQAVIAARGAP